MLSEDASLVQAATTSAKTCGLRRSDLRVRFASVCVAVTAAISSASQSRAGTLPISGRYVCDELCRIFDPSAEIVASDEAAPKKCGPYKKWSIEGDESST